MYDNENNKAKFTLVLHANANEEFPRTLDDGHNVCLTPIQHANRNARHFLAFLPASRRLYGGSSRKGCQSGAVEVGSQRIEEDTASARKIYKTFNFEQPGRLS